MNASSCSVSIRLTGDISLCQDPIGWKAPVRAPQPTTPKQQKAKQQQQQQPQQTNHQQTANLPIKQLEVTEEPIANGDVDSPTATSNGPAVQPVSAKKSKGSGKPQQAANATGGDEANVSEDPEKKAKKVWTMSNKHCCEEYLCRMYVPV